MADNAAGSVAGNGAEAGKGAAGSGAAAGAGEGTSILDSAVAPGAAKAGEPNGKASDATDKSAGAPKGDEKGSEQKGDATAAVGAPEKYEFKAPEGVTLDPKATEDFSALAKSLNLPQDAAQKLVDFQLGMVKAAQDNSLKAFNDMQKEWAAETRKSLGANADKELSYAAAFRDQFLDKDARQVLRDSGFDNHPALIKAFIAAGKAIAEDKLIEGKPDGAGKPEKTAAQVIYPNQK